MFTRIAALCGLYTLAIAQPLLDLTSQNPQFFIAHRFSTADFLLYCALLCFAVPILASLLLSLLQGIHITLAKLLSAALITVFVALITARTLRLMGFEQDWMLVLAAVTGCIFVVAMHYFDGLLRFSAWLAVAVCITPLVFLVSNWQFLASNELAPGGGSKSAEDTPVVLVVLDELPLSTLLSDVHQIDALRFPNFARLAQLSTWYPQAKTVADSTHIALPALLTGRFPDPQAANASYHANSPRNLFTLLEASHEIQAIEPITWLCPDSICPHESLGLRSPSQRFKLIAEDSAIIYAHMLLPEAYRQSLPSIGDRWIGFARKHKKKAILVEKERHRLETLDALRTLERGQLKFFHLLMPHTPWDRYADGRRYLAGSSSQITGLSKYKKWSKDRRATETGFQRHLQQAAFTDRYVGEMLDTLQNNECWEETLFILVADHGISFNAGDQYRYATDSNIGDILPVPLFVKYPGQSQAAIDFRQATLIDILPTILDELAVDTSGTLDGRSLLLNASTAPAQARYAASNMLRSFKIKTLTSAESATPVRPHALKSRLSVGAGVGNRFLFDLSSEPSLLGRASSELAALPGDRKLTNSNLQNLRADTDTETRPGLLRAHLPDAFFAARRLIAVAVNGVIVANSRLHQHGKDRFDILLPAKAFSEQSNTVEVFWLDSDSNRWKQFLD